MNKYLETGEINVAYVFQVLLDNNVQNKHQAFLTLHREYGHKAHPLKAYELYEQYVAQQ